MSLRALQGPTGGGAPVGGTGTTNYIPRWNPGPSTLGDSIIIQGSTANAIGIGNAPTTDLAGYKALEVGGLGSGFVNADNDLWITANAKHSGGGWKYAVTASMPSNSIRANAGAIIFNRAIAGTASNPITWLESARITDTGNVGIGTASPGSYDAGARNLVVGSGTGNQGITIAGGGNLNLYFATGTTGGDPYRGYIRYTAAGDAFTFATASTVRASLGGSSLDISSTAGYGLKLPATPGNPDTQTLDCYQEIGTGTPAEIALTLTCGTSGTITVNAASSKARVTRVGNKVIGHGRIVVSSVSAPLGRLSCVLTGCPQPFTNFLVETQTDNTTGLASGNRIVGTSDTAATPTIYFDRYSPNTSSTDAAANIQAGTIIVFNICYSV